MRNTSFRFARAALVIAAIGTAGTSFGAALNISDDPLFLGYTVDPNVFFMLDDSGSMDWEITTVPHWDACGYDAAYPNGSCSVTLRSDGSFYLYRWKEQKLSTTTTWSSNGSTGTTNFQYVFSNADNMYGTTCDAGNTAVASCVLTLADTQSTTKVQTGSGSGCTAPSGYAFTYVSGSGSTKKCGYYVPYNNRWSAYKKDWRVYSSDFNTTYYNPATKYEAWPSTGMTDATFTAVRSHPQSGQTGYSYTRSLNDDMGDLYDSVASGFVYEVWSDTHGYSGTSPTKTNRTTGANGIIDVWDEHDRYVVTSTTVTKYRVTYTSSGSGLTENVDAGTVILTTDAFGRTPAEIRQNVANWYQYSRRRMLMAKGAVGEVVAGNTDFRFGLSVINMTTTTASTSSTTDHSTIFAKVPDSSVTDYTTHNTTLLNNLYKFISPAKGTPLRRGLDNAGRYFAGQTVYKTDSGSLSSTSYTNPMTESCQQNFSVLVTDGYWNDGADPATSGINDKDGDGYKNSGSTEDSTLADVSRFYADHDLNASFPNNVPVIDSTGQPTGTETFQHMITFTAAFGVEGELEDTNSPTDGIPDQSRDQSTGAITPFTASPSAKWGKNPWTYDSGKIDDMWHAAYNSGGSFISARSPEDLVNGLNKFMEQIQAQTGSSSSVAASSGSFRTDTLLYLAKFTSQYWYGQLEAYALTTDANGDVHVSSSPSWDAGARLLDQVTSDGYLNGREILTMNPVLANGSRQGKGIPFNFPAIYGAPTATEMSAALISKLIPYSISTAVSTEIVQNQLKGANLVNWLRGDTSNDESVPVTGYLRHRVDADGNPFLLGDIVNSSPKYVAAPSRLYPNLMEGASNPYSDFREKYKDRTPMIYVGANDGMLHAFNGSTGGAGGKEVFAYVPTSVYGRLSAMALPDYSHKYSVDGTAEINDVFFDGSWHTVLVGGLAGGGQGIYALDVTKGFNVDEGAAADTVLWEFTDTNYVPSLTAGAVGSNGDNNLGYTYSRPQLVKMANGKWVAIFGNGYNNTTADGSASTTGYAYIYFVEIGTGKLLRRIEIPVGTTTTPNGLSTVTVADADDDYVADYIYGGDLYGNMWRFDVQDANPDNWKIGHSGKAIFQTSSTPLGKPITVKPSVSRHPTGVGLMVLFGTGKFIEKNDSDSDDKTTQTFYGLWDTFTDGSLTYPIPASTLLEQSITEEVTHSSGAEVRVTSDNGISYGTHRGWYFDLEVGGANNGEVVATDSVVRGDRIIFISMMPPASPCETGGTAWIYELNFANGARLPYSPIDVNGDGAIDSLDKVTSNGESVAGGGFKKDNLLSTPTILADTQTSGQEHKIMATSAGTFENVGESTDGTLGRRSWRQLH